MGHDSQNQTVKYYGKKRYQIKLRLTWEKATSEKTPDYSDNELESNRINIKTDR